MGYDFFRKDDERPESMQDSASDLKPQDTAKNIDLFESKVDKVNDIVENVAEGEIVEAKEEAIEAKEEEIKEMVEEGATKEEVKEAIKELEAIYGDNQYKIPAEAKFRHKVDGEDVEVGLQDLLNNYSGQQSWDKKFTELDGERKVYKQDLDVVNKYINEFAEVSKNDKVEGLIKLAESVGIDPLEYKKQLRSELLSKYGEYLNMDEGERSLYEQKEELDYLRRKQESELQKRSEQQSQMDLQKRYSEIQETHSIDNDRLNYLANELQTVYKADVNPENVLELHSSIVRLDRVDSALNKVNPELTDDDQKVLQLESLLRGNPQMTEEQLDGMAVKLWGSDVRKAVANLEKKTVKKEVPEAQKKPHKYQSKLNHSGPSIDFFDK